MPFTGRPWTNTSPWEAGSRPETSDKRRRFAASGRSDHGDELAWGDVEVDVAQRRVPPAVAGREALRRMAQRDRWSTVSWHVDDGKCDGRHREPLRGLSAYCAYCAYCSLCSPVQHQAVADDPPLGSRPGTNERTHRAQVRSLEESLAHTRPAACLRPVAHPVPVPSVGLTAMSTTLTGSKTSTAHRTRPQTPSGSVPTVPEPVKQRHRLGR